MKTKLFQCLSILLFQFFIIVVQAQTFPDAPSNLTATPSATVYEIVLNWTDNSDNETEFTISREDDEGNTVETTVPANTTMFTDSMIVPNVQYYYTVWAANDYGISEEITVSAMLVREAPPVPTNVSAMTGPMTSVQVNFTDNSDVETFYEIQHSVSSDFEGSRTESVVGGATGNVVTFYINDGPFTDPENQQYYYPPNTLVYARVRGVINDNGTFIYGPYTSLVSAYTNDYPAKPSDFTATVVGEDIHLSWTDNSDNEAAFFLGINIGEVNPNTMIFVERPADSTTYVFHSAEADVEYVFTLLAADLFEYQATPPEFKPELLTNNDRVVETRAMRTLLPPAPMIVMAQGLSIDGIRVSFVDNSDIEDWYEIEAGTSPEGPFDAGLLEVSGANVGDTIEADVFSLAANTTYYLRMRGAKVINDTTAYGPYSEVISGMTLPDDGVPTAPVALRATYVRVKSFIAHWEPVAGADYYELDVYTLKGHMYLPGYQSKIVYDTTLMVTGTKKDVKYGYVVRAVNEEGVSENSNEIPVASVKNLIFYAVCSDNPAEYKRWKIINNNPFPIDVTWEVRYTDITGTLVAPIGASYFTTPATPKSRKVLISWYTDRMAKRLVIKKQSNQQCVQPKEPALARHDVEAKESENELLFKVEAFPNPASNQFNIAVTGLPEKEVSVEILNFNGQRVLTRTVAPHTILEVDASAYPSGLYLIKARQMKNQQITKVIKR